MNSIITNTNAAIAQAADLVTFNHSTGDARIHSTDLAAMLGVPASAVLVIIQKYVDEFYELEGEGCTWFDAPLPADKGHLTYLLKVLPGNRGGHPQVELQEVRCKEPVDHLIGVGGLEVLEISHFPGAHHKPLFDAIFDRMEVVEQLAATRVRHLKALEKDAQGQASRPGPHSTAVQRNAA